MATDLRTDPRRDVRLSSADHIVLRTVMQWPGVTLGMDDIGFPTLAYFGDERSRPTLNRLAARAPLAKHGVFASVARLENFGYLPDGVIR